MYKAYINVIRNPQSVFRPSISSSFPFTFSVAFYQLLLDRFLQIVTEIQKRIILTRRTCKHYPFLLSFWIYLTLFPCILFELMAGRSKEYKRTVIENTKCQSDRLIMRLRIRISLCFIYFKICQLQTFIFKAIVRTIGCTLHLSSQTAIDTKFIADVRCSFSP